MSNYFMKDVDVMRRISRKRGRVVFETYEEIKNNPILFMDYYEKLSAIQDGLPYKFRARLRSLRDYIGLTREALEEVSYISSQTIKQIELNEDRNYSIETIISLCIGMKLPPDLSFDLIKCAGFNIDAHCSKKYALYRFILRNLYMNNIDEINDFLIKNGEKSLSNF